MILKTDCLIEMRKSDTSSDSNSEWYVPDDDGETLAETEGQSGGDRGDKEHCRYPDGYYPDYRSDCFLDHRTEEKGRTAEDTGQPSGQSPI